MPHRPPGGRVPYRPTLQHLAARVTSWRLQPLATLTNARLMPVVMVVEGGGHGPQGAAGGEGPRSSPLRLQLL